MTTSNLKPYSAYKDSGVEWLGEVPQHWTVLPGRACYVEKKVPNLTLKEKNVLSLSYGRIVVKPPEKLHGLVPSSFESYQIVEPLDIIVRPTDLQNDWNSLRFGLSRHLGIITSAYLCFRTKNTLTPEFGHLLLHSYDLMKVFYGLGSGLRQNLDWSDFKHLACSIPPLPEQTAILRFLDHANRRIRRYILAKQKLIVLLEEQKQAIIHQAVTGQIDVRTGEPYPVYKDSGVEWLGQMPDQWEVRRLRTVAEMRVSNVDKHTKDDELPVRLCNYVDVYNNDRITREIPFMKATASRGEIERFRLNQDDVLITKDSEAWDDIGVPALVTEPADNLLSGYHLAILRPLNQMLGAYLAWCLQNRAIARQFHTEAKGVTRYGLTHTGIKSVKILLPSLLEQTAIVAYLDRTSAAVESTVTDTYRQIEVLQEYNNRLIADVVTGKLDVREAAAELAVEGVPGDPDNSAEDYAIEMD